MELRDVIKQRRDFLNITQPDLAEMARVGLATVKDIERGKGNPSLSTITKTLEIIGMEISYKVKTRVSQKPE